jgi:large subunit ribosomal protein L15
VKQNELIPTFGSNHRRKRVGRGNASGHGTFCGRGIKGQKSRTGWGGRVGFQGGQLALIKSLPAKRGFTNNFRIEYDVVNVSNLNVFESGAEVTREALVGKGLLKSANKPVKILGTGDINRPLKITVDKFSTSAKTKIEAAGGTITEVIGGSEAK